MRWITFLILLYLSTVLQTGKLGAMPARVQGAVPAQGQEFWPSIEYLPMLAVFYALYASDSAAPLAALMCGAMYDVTNRSGDFIGTNLVPLALTALFILRVRLSIFREHFISQMLMTLVAILTYALLSVFYRKLIGASLAQHSMWHHFAELAGNGVYTAIVAPFIFALLFRFHNLLGFTTHGPRTRGHG